MAQAQPGRLVIAGGALSPDNAWVHAAVLTGLPASGRIAVIAIVSGEPVSSAAAFAQTLAAHAAAADRIDMIRPAVMDHPSPRRTMKAPGASAQPSRRRSRGSSASGLSCAVEPVDVDARARPITAAPAGRACGPSPVVTG